MSHEDALTPPTAAHLSVTPGTPGQVRLVYWAFLLGLILPGLNVIAAVLAWRARNTGDGLTRSHAANQISIFWRSVVYVGIGLVLTYFLFGVLVIMAAIIWYILRVLRGLKALSAGQPPEHPQSWLF
jgi:uncharacterized membrane protein